MTTSRLRLTFFACALAALGAEAETSDWPFWRGAQGSGVARETGWGNEGKLLWKASVGLGYSAPSVVGGRLYTRGFDTKESVDVTRCLDAETGKEIWRHENPARNLDNMHEGGTLTTPTVAAGKVFVLSRLGDLFAFEPETGEIVWDRNVVEEFEVTIGYFGLSCSPLLEGGKIVLNVGKAIALDPATGKTLWASEDYGYSYATPAAFTWRGARHLAVFNAKGLVVLNAEDGKEVALHPWTSNYNVNAATPIVIDDRIFISTGYDEKGCAMLALTDEGLEVIWEGKQVRSKMNGCVLFDDHLYGFDAKLLKCLDLDGNVLWTERGLGLGTVIVADRRLIVLSEEGGLIVAGASPEGFTRLAEQKVLDGGVCWTTPVISGGRIYCRNNKGDLVCRDHRPSSTDEG